jgi:hypothetical protein
MKQILFAFLLFTVTYLSSCKIDSVLPAVKQTANEGQGSLGSGGQNPSTLSPGLNPDTTNIKGNIHLQLARDPVNTDNILIDFNPNAKTAYVPNEDAPSLPGSGWVSLSSLSSDSVALSINTLPLTNQRLTIGLVVNAKTDGVYNLNMISINSVPSIFEIWLIDNYKKDSLDFRQNKSYAFDLYKADTNSYGSHRFSLVIHEDLLLGVHLLNFKAVKTTAGTKCTWVTENEQNYTGFSIERSTDNGQTYNSLTSFMSSGLGTYTFVDTTPVIGKDLYRLKFQDINGVISYSSVISLIY